MTINNLVENIQKTAFGLSMATVWQHLDIETKTLNLSLEDRTNYFYQLLGALFDKGVIGFGSNKCVVEKDFGEIINDIKKEWPNSPDEDDLDGFGFWFFETCPYGLVWVSDDGRMVWT